MNEYDISNLYLPPKKWDGRAEEWYDQVDRISQHVREQIAQEIETYMDNYSDDYSNSIRRVLVSIVRGNK